MTYIFIAFAICSFPSTFEEEEVQTADFAVGMCDVQRATCGTAQ